MYGVLLQGKCVQQLKIYLKQLSQEGRITKWSAEAMLARFYFTRAGVESTGGVQESSSFWIALNIIAQRVINNEWKQICYRNMQICFKYPYDNNAESLFELQWVFSGPDVWGTNNSMPEYLAYSPDIAFGGWGGDKGATWWLMSAIRRLCCTSQMVL